jgi:hypothetical protein
LITPSHPATHPLRKICNRNTIKLSYRCTPDMSTIISAQNAKLMKAPKPEKRTCNCTRNKVCPFEGKCLTEGVMYKATVIKENGSVNTYTGLTSNSFKARLGSHTHLFINTEANQTTLSNHIHGLKQNKIE